MDNLQTIIVIAAVLVIVISLWAIFYFGSRIITRARIRRDLGDMPSAEELSEWYRQNNDIIRYREHSPTREEKV
jgi:hypothetical protein